MKRSRPKGRALQLVKQHFRDVRPEELVTAAREFPVTTRPDLQGVLDQIFRDQFETKKLVGVHSDYNHQTLTFANVAVEGNFAAQIGPLQYDEVDVGEIQPCRCLKTALWLSEEKGTRFALLLTQALHYGRPSGVHLEIAVTPGERGTEFSRRLFDRIERQVNQASSYRGKALSLEQSDNYRGSVGAIRIHKLRSVDRSQIILPEKTIRLLERNVTQFIAQRDRLKSLGMATKKGLLFYGPPGTGKTHTIHYLASQLKGHTTLLITADQVGLLDYYMQLARFLQPAMVVLEDVDLIARDRKSKGSACEESVLNRLLNEMDGLREEASVLFVLTTNRPEQLEAALASRPGRIDQAIEFPLPDEEGRQKLIRLYSGGLKVGEDVSETAVRKTKGASAAFIKELMRRAAQFLVEENGGNKVEIKHIEAALDEMLFAGGTLNVKLLGGAQP
ncbi:MAG TPA: ATP-binding protein [Verrucomicrobiae bacterium]|nr:ATP-binding protein [Verrucomicrobiae bacterium]